MDSARASTIPQTAGQRGVLLAWPQLGAIWSPAERQVLPGAWLCWGAGAQDLCPCRSPRAADSEGSGNAGPCGHGEHRAGQWAVWCPSPAGASVQPAVGAQPRDILASIFRVSKLFSSFSSLPAHRTERSHQLGASAQCYRAGHPGPCGGEGGPPGNPQPGWEPGNGTHHCHAWPGLCSLRDASCWDVSWLFLCPLPTPQPGSLGEQPPPGPGRAGEARGALLASCAIVTFRTPQVRAELLPGK